ncbi:phosphoglycerate dehydrogenase [Clostridium formicaceticum]|uniref:Dihydrofolate reductase n=1 Tax=Clostridium formicaceticum TaxID=1497 RepID=A0AAC9WH55_9CLOT|nr:phosphoglycerate dehydrogenase [Clostridium formicaceticum]AOY78102.1 dihydrofolate reductase [Clostridium formicaceticum]ARE88752.1 Glyoxylate/hydroxypyruvate reductase B [Clostridium formicaceticum]
MKVLFTYDYGKEKMESIKKLGYDIILRSEKGIVYTEEIQDVEALICYHPFATLDIAKMKKLRWIQLSSIGIDQVPKEIARKNKILITNNKGGYSIPIGEWIVLKILEVYKKSSKLYQQQQQRRWEMDTSLLELYRKRIGFIGTGSIAAEAAKRLQGFEVHTIGVNTKGTKVKYFDSCYPIDQLEEVLRSCDVIVLTVPHTKESHHLINKTRLAMMKKEAVFINISRGNIVDEEALIEHLQKGNFLGVALDVFEKEPLPQESPLWEMDNVLVTPHNCWISEMRNERRFRIIYENMKKFKEQQPLINQVDINKGY